MSAKYLAFLCVCMAVAGGWLAAPALPAAPGKAPSGRFAIGNVGKTVLDRANGLVWERGFSVQPLAWQPAKDRCSQNTPGLPGSGWHLPNRAELLTLVDSAAFSPAIDPVFTATPSDNFWSATPLAKSAAVWLVSFKTGEAATVDATFAAFGRCVR